MRMEVTFDSRGLTHARARRPTFDSPQDITLRWNIGCLRVVKVVPRCFVITWNGAHALHFALSLCTLFGSLWVLLGSHAEGWGIWMKPQGFVLQIVDQGGVMNVTGDFSAWFGYASYGDRYLHRDFSVDSWNLQEAGTMRIRLLGILVGLYLCMSAVLSLLFGLASLAFLNGWMEIGESFGGSSAAIPELLLSVSGLLLGGMFYGVASTWLAHGRMVDLVSRTNPRTSRLLHDNHITFSPGWALYICFGIVGIAYVLMFWLTAVMPTHGDLKEWLRKVADPPPPKLLAVVTKLPAGMVRVPIHIPAARPARPPPRDSLHAVIVIPHEPDVTATAAGSSREARTEEENEYFMSFDDLMPVQSFPPPRAMPRPAPPTELPPDTALLIDKLLGMLEIAEHACGPAPTGKGASDLCPICFEAYPNVAVEGCRHVLCSGCARTILQKALEPPTCPFCRRPMGGFLVALPIEEAGSAGCSPRPIEGGVDEKGDGDDMDKGGDLVDEKAEKNPEP